MAMSVHLGNVAPNWLRDLLVELKLDSSLLLTKLCNELLINRPIHFEYVNDADLARIGLSQPSTRQMILETVKRKFTTSPTNSVCIRLVPYDAVYKCSATQSDALVASAESRSLVRITAPGLKCLLASSDLAMFEVLGESALGVLHRAEWKTQSGKQVAQSVVHLLQTPVAARVLRRDCCMPTSATGTLPDDVVTELNAMFELNHHNVMRFLGVVTPTLSQTLLFEYSELGSLKSHLLAPRDVFGEFIITVSMLLTFAVQVVHALKYMERKGYVHGNLAACNIMLATQEQVKIGDYGLAKILQTRRDFVQMRGPWFAPENFDSNVFTHLSDTWMFGVVLWEIFSCGADPWKGSTVAQIRKLLLEDNRLARPAKCPDQVHLVMTHCWRMQPKDRLKFEQVLAGLNEVALPVMRSAGDYKEGQFEVKNGDDLIIIKGGCDSPLWTGQNKRTGFCGDFPQALLLPSVSGIAPKRIGNDSETASSGDKSASVVLMEFEDTPPSASSKEHTPEPVSIKLLPMSGWTTFESTTDLTCQTAASNVVTHSSPKDETGASKSSSDRKRGVDNLSGFEQLAKFDIPNSFPEHPQSRRFNLESVEIDVSDQDLLLPAASVTSLSEPCSPVHQTKPRNTTGLHLENLSFDNTDESRLNLSHSLPSSKFPDRLMLTTSASCENLSAGSPQRPSGQPLFTATHFSENLTKSSSDSPVYDLASRGSVPPVPPRDYPKRSLPSGSRGKTNSGSSTQHAVIHPILQDGHQRSSTHYWLLPEKINHAVPAQVPHASATHSPYINMTDKDWRRTGVVANQTALEETLSTTAAEDVEPDRPRKPDEKESYGSMVEAREKISQVQKLLGVESVSHEEVLTALQGQQWSVANAVEYLKVEHLFRIGIASRPVCRSVLDAHRWDLESAASALLDRCGNR